MATYGERIQAAVAAQIRAEMGALHLSQSDLGKMVGVGQNTISRYTNADDAKRNDLPYKVFADIAKALGLTPRELAERAERRLGGNDVS